MRLAWLVSTEEQLTYIYKPSEDLRKISFDELIFGEEVLVEFSVRLSEILEY